MKLKKFLIFLFSQQIEGIVYYIYNLLFLDKNLELKDY